VPGAPPELLSPEPLQALPLLSAQPRRSPLSRSACRTHLRSVSAVEPIFFPIELIAALCDA